MGRIYIALDTEATGLRAESDEIIEIGAVRFRDGQILDRWQTFVRPSQPLPYKITALTGITAADVRGGPPLYKVAADLIRFVGDNPIVGHSIDIDLAMLKRQGVPLRNRAYDTFELATLLLPEVPVYSLAAVAAALGIQRPMQHRAVADSEMTMGVFEALLGRLADLPPQVLSEINQAAAGSEWPLRGLFADMEREAAHAAFSLPLPGGGGNLGSKLAAALGQAEFDLGLLRPLPLPPPLSAPENAGTRPLDTAALVATLDTAGPLAAAFPAYEPRPQQVAMLEAVAGAFNDGTHLVVEAGTGTGKSLAYLLPAIRYAVANNTRVVVATATINLQEQLYNKDLPTLTGVLDTPFRAATLKGRSNYICLRRWAAFRRAAPATLDELRLLVKVLVWLPKTGTGERGELLLTGSEPHGWGKIAVSDEGCPLHECIHNQKGLCFFQRAKKTAEAAHVLVVNHALLLADIATGNRVLPPYTHLIIDEAHHLEDEATDQLGYAVTGHEPGELVAGLSKRQGEGYSGYLSDLRRLFRPRSSGGRDAVGAPPRVRVAEATLATIETYLERLHTTCDRVPAAAHDLFECMHRLLTAQSEERNEYDKRLRLTARVRKDPQWGEIQLTWENLALPLTAIISDLNRLIELIEELDADESELTNVGLEIGNLWGQIDLLYSHLHAAITQPSDGAVYWLSANAREATTTIHCAPLHVGELLDRYLFSSKRTVVLASATLATDGDFSYMRERLGLVNSQELQVGSPFDYPRSTLLYIPDDLAEPNQPGYQKQLESAILDLCRASGGRALVLFTSHSALRTTYRALQRPMEEAGLLLLGHNVDGSRRQLLDRFRSTPRSVLLGTSSFWEGIDVVGDALSVLIIAKLPFRVPSDPVFAARSEGFDDAFAQYALPQAILRFKQGFGRLIRHRDDRGVVAVLDRRVVSKSYGRLFLHALPTCTQREGPAHGLGAAAAAWLAEGSGARGQGSGDGE